MSKHVHGDAVGLGFDPEKLQREVEMEVAEAMREVKAANVMVAGHRRLGNMPGAAFPQRKPRNTHNQYNIVGGTIGTAIIGNTGPVVLNQQKKVFHEGAHNTNYKITGGNFSQANVGGKSEYNNKGASISAGAGKGPGTRGTGISVEDVTMAVLEKGVSAEDLIKLLENGYSLSCLAFSLPQEPQKRNLFVKALITD